MLGRVLGDSKMSDINRNLELEALAAVGKMLLFDQARGKPEEAQRILQRAQLFTRSEEVAQCLSELCAEAGNDATWHESILEELQDGEDLEAEQEESELVLRIYRLPSGHWTGVLLSGSYEIGHCGSFKSPDDVQEAASQSSIITDRIEVKA